MRQDYHRVVQLLLDAAPEIFRRGSFILKGGTAINLFVRELPRLSVDLDLVYADYTLSRDEAIAAIAGDLEEASRRLEKRGIHARSGSHAGPETKLFLERENIRVKIEVNQVFRGSLLPSVALNLTDLAQELFFTELKLPVLAREELYASKLVAALDRQHPRDLFDMWLLLNAEGISPSMVDCFVCYLAGHNRPVHEVLFNSPKPLTRIFQNEFLGMTRQAIELDALERTQTHLLQAVPAMLEGHHREFLLTLVNGLPDWSLLPFPHLQDLPAIKWKLKNLLHLQKTHPAKFDAQRRELDLRFRQSSGGGCSPGSDPKGGR